MKSSKTYFVFLVVVLTVAAQACSISQRLTLVTTESPMQTQLPPVESPISPTSKADVQNDSPTATASPRVSITRTSRSPAVTVTAVSGNLAIRTGPDVAFDAIAMLRQGETAPAFARSILDGWLQIPIPSQPGETGWVSIKTSYSVVSGNVLDLPRIDVVEWPTGSYLRNCTSHRMIVEPGDKILEPLSNSPNNRAWFSPGRYSVFDLDVSGKPVVMNLSLAEHREVSVRKDGNGQHWDCL